MVSRRSVWLGDGERRKRAVQPAGLDRGRITEVTVRLLDAEGLDKFSMRRLASELKVTAMSVYWYVDTKDDLLELALDSVYDELPVPEEDADWRHDLRQLAIAYRQLLVHHPWVSPLAGRYLNIGPNSLTFSQSIQQILRRTTLPTRDIQGAIAAVLQFVYGFGTMEGLFYAQVAASGQTPDAYYEQSMTAVGAHPDTALAVERSKDLISARGAATVGEMQDRDFTFALDLLIAGVEAMVRRGRGEGEET